MALSDDELNEAFSRLIWKSQDEVRAMSPEERREYQQRRNGIRDILSQTLGVGDAAVSNWMRNPNTKAYRPIISPQSRSTMPELPDNLTEGQKRRKTTDVKRRIVEALLAPEPTGGNTKGYQFGAGGSNETPPNQGSNTTPGPKFKSISKFRSYLREQNIFDRQTGGASLRLVRRGDGFPAFSLTYYIDSDPDRAEVDALDVPFF